MQFKKRQKRRNELKVQNSKNITREDNVQCLGSWEVGL